MKTLNDIIAAMKALDIGIVTAAEELEKWLEAHPQISFRPGQEVWVNRQNLHNGRITARSYRITKIHILVDGIEYYLNGLGKVPDEVTIYATREEAELAMAEARGEGKS